MWTQWTCCMACYGNPNGPPTGCLSLSWSPTSLPVWHSYIHEYRHTSGCGPKLKLKWMTEFPMKMCVCVCMHVCKYVCVCVPCRVKHKTAAKPCYERKRAVASTHAHMYTLFWVTLWAHTHSHICTHESARMRRNSISHISGWAWVYGLGGC